MEERDRVNWKMKRLRFLDQRGWLRIYQKFDFFFLNILIRVNLKKNKKYYFNIFFLTPIIILIGEGEGEKEPKRPSPLFSR